ncbi:MAG: daptide biosynthesis intramembrane metalloprotease [Microbacterium sp.]
MFDRSIRSSRSRAVTFDDQPRLAAGVTFEHGPDHGSWLVIVSGVPSSRVSRSVVELLSAMDGGTSVRALHGRFAAEEDEDSFLRLLSRFEASGLLSSTQKQPVGRVTFRPPFTVQVATMNAPRIFSWIDEAVRPITRAWMLFPLVAVAAIGFVATIVQLPRIQQALTSPLPLPGFLTVIVVMSFATFLHEAAHGLTLTRFGATPRRAGFMIFYFNPAFFVDVTDGWRLPHRWHRVVVALSGPATNVVIGSLCAIASGAMGDSSASHTLVVLAVACYGVVLVNLIPFVRFDGYIAFMSAIDEPNLRVRAMADAAAFVSRRLYGGPVGSRQLVRWWTVPFGLLSYAVPFLLVWFAIGRVVRGLSGGGAFVAVAVLALQAFVAVIVVAMLVRTLSRTWRSGISRVRFVLVNAALVSAVVFAGSSISIPSTMTVGFVATGHEEAILVESGTGLRAALTEDRPVELLSNGVLANIRYASGTATPISPVGVAAPVNALFPIEIPGATVPVAGIASVRLPDDVDLPPAGLARVELDSHNAWQALWETHVLRPLAGVGGGSSIPAE